MKDKEAVICATILGVLVVGLAVFCWTPAYTSLMHWSVQWQVTMLANPYSYKIAATVFCAIALAIDLLSIRALKK